MEKYIPYAKINVNYSVTPNGYNNIDNLDSIFRGITARDKVICRSDLLTSLRDVVTEENLKKYRELLWAVLSGKLTDATSVSQILTAFYTDDKKFKEYITAQFYLERSNDSFGIQVLKDLIQRVATTEQVWRTHLKPQGVKVFEVANMYVYYAVDDIAMTLSLPKNCVCEVLSNAKIWQGKTS